MEALYLRYKSEDDFNNVVLSNNMGILGDNGLFYMGSAEIRRYLGIRPEDMDEKAFNIFDFITAETEETKIICRNCEKRCPSRFPGVARQVCLKPWNGKPIKRSVLAQVEDPTDGEYLASLPGTVDEKRNVRLYMRIFDPNLMLRTENRKYGTADEILIIPQRLPKKEPLISLTVPEFTFGRMTTITNENEFLEAMREMYRVGRESRTYVKMSLKKFVKGYVKGGMKDADDYTKRKVVGVMLSSEPENWDSKYGIDTMVMDIDSMIEDASDNPIGSTENFNIEKLELISGVPALVFSDGGDWDSPLYSVHYPKPDGMGGWEIGRFVPYTMNKWITPLGCTSGTRNDRSIIYPCDDEGFDMKVADPEEEFREVFSPAE